MAAAGRPRDARGRRGPLLLLFAALVMGLVAPVVPAAPATAVEPTARRTVTGWLPHWATTQALAAVEANADLFHEASPFWYQAKASGTTATISSSLDAVAMSRIVASLQGRGIPVVPSVADGSAARAMAALIKDPAARTAHVAQLVALATTNGFDGLELDYEKFAYSDGSSTWAATRPAWVAFVTELGNALHAAGKRLALAVPPIYDGTRSSSSGYWVYDYEGIAPVVDSLRIMTYDYSVSRPGPISPLSFVKRSLAYAVTAFPADRIRMGLPAYGRLWTARHSDGSLSVTGKCPATGVPGTRSFTTATALTFLTTEAGGAPVMRYDETTAEMVATFSQTYAGKDASGAATSCVVDRVAWWVDARGVTARMAIADQFGVAGAAVWQLGGVDADSWAALRAHATNSPLAATTVNLSAPAQVAAGAAVPITVTAASSTPIPAGTPVTLERRPHGWKSWQTVTTSPIDAAGAATFTLGGLTTTTTWRVRVDAAWNRMAGQAVATTKAAPTVTVNTSTTAPKRGAKVTLKVRVKPAVKGFTVKRQMLVKGKWRTMTTKRTTAKGAVSFSFRWPKAKTSRTYRVVTSAKGGLVAGSSGTFRIATR